MFRFVAAPTTKEVWCNNTEQGPLLRPVLTSPSRSCRSGRHAGHRATTAGCSRGRRLGSGRGAPYHGPSHAPGPPRGPVPPRGPGPPRGHGPLHAHGPPHGHALSRGHGRTRCARVTAARSDRTRALGRRGHDHGGRDDHHDRDAP